MVGPRKARPLPALWTRRAPSPPNLPQISAPGVNQLGGSGQAAAGEACLLDERLQLVAQCRQAVGRMGQRAWSRAAKGGVAWGKVGLG